MIGKVEKLINVTKRKNNRNLSFKTSNVFLRFWTAMRAEMRRLKKIQQSKNQQSETRCFHSFVQKGRLLLKEIAWKIKRHKWRIFCHRVWICRLWLRIPERRHQSAQRNGEFLEHTEFFLDFTVSKLFILKLII